MTITSQRQTVLLLLFGCANPIFPGHAIDGDGIPEAQKIGASMVVGNDNALWVSYELSEQIFLTRSTASPQADLDPIDAPPLENVFSWQGNQLASTGDPDQDGHAELAFGSQLLDWDGQALSMDQRGSILGPGDLDRDGADDLLLGCEQVAYGPIDPLQLDSLPAPSPTCGVLQDLSAVWFSETQFSGTSTLRVITGFPNPISTPYTLSHPRRTGSKRLPACPGKTNRS